VLSIQWPDEEEEDEEELFFCFSNRFCLLNPLPGNSSLAPNVEKERRQKTKNKKLKNVFKVFCSSHNRCFGSRRFG
jgi:hypothetical protein